MAPGFGPPTLLSPADFPSERQILWWPFYSEVNAFVRSVSGKSAGLWTQFGWLESYWR
jgi:hypothetical protein